MVQVNRTTKANLNEQALKELIVEWFNEEYEVDIDEDAIRFDTTRDGVVSCTVEYNEALQSAVDR